MAETTNLKLYKPDNPSTNNDNFDIEKSLYANWDKIDDAYGENTKSFETNTKNIETNKTNIENNVKSIEALLQENESLKEEIQTLKEDNKINGLTEDNSGELIHIENTTGARFNSLEIYGNEKQETREGYNILNLKDWTITEKVRVNVVGEIEENTVQLKTNANTASVSYYLRLKKTIPAGTYYLQKKFETIEEGLGGINYGQIFIAKSDWSKEYCRIYPTDGKKSFTLSEETEVILALVIKGSSDTGTEEREIKFYNLMLSSEDKEYEPYGAMPSFGYPSEVECVGDNKCVSLNVIGKNFLNTNNISSVFSGVRFESNLDGSLNISGTPTIKYISIRNKLKLDYPIKAGTKISLLFGKTTDLQKDSGLTPYIWTYDKDNEGAGNINTSSSDYSLVSTKDITNITFGIEGFNTSINYNTKLYLMLVVGDIIQSKYIQYQKQSYIVPVQQKMLTGDGFSKKDSKRKEVHTWQEVVFNGEENWLMNYGTSLFNLASNNIYNQSSTEHKALCNMAKFESRQAIMADLADKHFAMQSAYNSIFFKDTDFKTAEEFKAKLKELYEAGTPLKVAYKVETPIELDCTEEQIAILDKIEKEAHTYTDITNIYTEDKVGAIIKTNTNVSLKAMFNSITA